MAEQAKWNPFEFYSQASQSWMDAFTSWTKMSGSFPQFKGADQTAWFKPFWDYAEVWGKMYGNMANTLDAMPFPFSVMKDMGDSVAKAMNSNVKVYDAWFKSMDMLSKEANEIGRRMGEGEAVETKPFFDSIKNSYANLSNAFMETLKAFSLNGSREIHEAIKNSTNSFTEEQEITAKLVEEMLKYNAKAANLSVSEIKKTTEEMTKLFEKGEISSGRYPAIIEAYGEMLKNSCEVLQLPQALNPGYEGIVDDATKWSKASLGFYAAWEETNLKVFLGMTKTLANIYKASEEMFKGGTVSSANDFYLKWSDIWEKATDTTANNSQIRQSLPKLINAQTEWAKATSQLYKTVTTSPYLTKDSLTRISHELEKVKKAMEKLEKSEKEEPQPRGRKVRAEEF
jgi:hypothetical protein